MKTRRVLLLVFGMVLFSGRFAVAQQAIFLLRHADTVRVKGNPDIPLSEAGERRAVTLAALLKDSGINVIYTTGLQRTVKTAGPLAKLLNIDPKIRPELGPGSKASDSENFVRLLRSDHSHDIVLVVLHSNSVPRLLKAFGYPAEVRIPASEFDNLFLITPRQEGPPTVLRLRY